MTAFSISSFRRYAGVGCGCLLWILVAVGCRSFPAPDARAKPDIYRSKDYIVCRLKSNETPRSLARRFYGDERRYWLIEDMNDGSTFSQGDTVVIPLREPNKGGLYPQGVQVVPILVYHRFARECSSPLCMRVEAFERQMRYLRDNGFHTISFAELLDFLQFRRAIPRKAVIITLDDGYPSTYDIAWPILKKYRFTATLFLVINNIHAGEHALSWDKVGKMKNEGCEIGAHSVTHTDLALPLEGEDDAAYLARVEEEIRLSKAVIDEKLGQDTFLFAFPYGSYNKTVLKMCRQNGLRAAVTVERGSNPFYADPMLLKRNQVLKPDIDYFAARLQTLMPLELE